MPRWKVRHPHPASNVERVQRLRQGLLLQCGGATTLSFGEVRRSNESGHGERLQTVQSWVLSDKCNDLRCV